MLYSRYCVSCVMKPGGLTDVEAVCWMLMLMLMLDVRGGEMPESTESTCTCSWLRGLPSLLSVEGSSTLKKYSNEKVRSGKLKSGKVQSGKEYMYGILGQGSINRSPHSPTALCRFDNWQVYFRWTLEILHIRLQTWNTSMSAVPRKFALNPKPLQMIH
jgi:hypothetical protein